MKPRSSISIQSDHCGTGVEPEQGSVSADPVVRRVLQGIINGMEVNPHARQDLLQEALAYLWSREKDYPAQRSGWYLQGVKFFLKDLRRSGRSVDSPKRRGAQSTSTDNSNRQDPWRDSVEFDCGIMSEVSARDIFFLLVVRLKPRDQFILAALFEGMGVREIACELHVPRGFVVRHRLKIARLAVDLGIFPGSAGIRFKKAFGCCGRRNEANSS